MMYRMDGDKRLGQMAQNLKEIIKKEKNMAREYIFGQMVLTTKVVGQIIK
jgi:hypothetical protein